MFWVRAAEVGGSVRRKDVEKLVGRLLSHVVQVVAEGNALTFSRCIGWRGRGCSSLRGRRRAVWRG